LTRVGSQKHTKIPSLGKKKKKGKKRKNPNKKGGRKEEERRKKGGRKEREKPYGALCTLDIRHDSRNLPPFLPNNFMLSNAKNAQI